MDAKKGLKVEITPYRGAGAAQEWLAAGRGRYHQPGPERRGGSHLKGVKEQIVGCGRQLAPETMASWRWRTARRKPSRILTGSRLVPVKNGTSDYYAQWAAEKVGITVQPTRLGRQHVGAPQSRPDPGQHRNPFSCTARITAKWPRADCSWR